MQKYNVFWNSGSEMKSGCVTVYAKSEMGAIANARNLLQKGNDFRVVRVCEGR